MSGKGERAGGHGAVLGDELVQEEPRVECLPRWMRGGTGPPGSRKHAIRLGTDDLEEAQEEPEA